METELEQVTRLKTAREAVELANWNELEYMRLAMTTWDVAMSDEFLKRRRGWGAFYTYPMLCVFRAGYIAGVREERRKKKKAAQRCSTERQEANKHTKV